MGLVPGFEDVQIAEEYCRDGRIAGGERVQAGGQPFPLAFGLFQPGVTARNVGADDLDFPGLGLEGDGRGASRRYSRAAVKSPASSAACAPGPAPPPADGIDDHHGRSHSCLDDHGVPQGGQVHRVEHRGEPEIHPEVDDHGSVHPAQTGSGPGHDPAAPQDNHRHPCTGTVRPGGRSAAREVVPGQGEEDDRGHDQQHRPQMPQESHPGRRTGRQVSSLRPTLTIHRQRRATCTGTRKRVTSAVLKWNSVQNGPVSG